MVKAAQILEESPATTNAENINVETEDPEYQKEAQKQDLLRNIRDEYFNVTFLNEIALFIQTKGLQLDWFQLYQLKSNPEAIFLEQEIEEEYLYSIRRASLELLRALFQHINENQFVIQIYAWFSHYRETSLQKELEMDTTLVLQREASYYGMAGLFDLLKVYLDFEEFIQTTLYHELDQEDPQNVLSFLKITIINLIYYYLVDRVRLSYNIPDSIFIPVCFCYTNEGNNICLRLTALKCLTVALTRDMQLLANLPGVMESTFHLMKQCHEIESKQTILEFIHTLITRIKSGMKQFMPMISKFLVGIFAISGSEDVHLQRLDSGPEHQNPELSALKCKVTEIYQDSIQCIGLHKDYLPDVLRVLYLGIDVSDSIDINLQEKALKLFLILINQINLKVISRSSKLKPPKENHKADIELCEHGPIIMGEIAPRLMKYKVSPLPTQSINVPTEVMQTRY